MKDFTGSQLTMVDIASVGRVGVSDETRTVYHEHNVSNGVSAFCRNEIVG